MKLKYNNRIASRNILLPEIILHKLEKAIELNPPSINGKFDKDMAIVMLWQICEVQQKRKDVYYQDGFIPLSSTILQEKCRKYNEYFDYFVDNKILEKRNYSTASHKCNSYKFVLDGEDSIIKFENYKVIAKKPLEIVESSYNISKCKRIKHLTKHLWKVKIDVGLAQRIKEEHLLNNVRKEDRMEVMLKDESSIRNIAEGNIFAIRGRDKDNRLHTNFTNLAKRYRQCLSVWGEKLINIDIKCSQPFFSNSIDTRTNNTLRRKDKKPQL